MDNLHDHGSIEHLAEEQANFCRVFGNARRVRILWALADGELSVGTIAEAVSSSIQNVSQHLSVMKSHDLVTARREGQTIYYRIDPKILADHCSGLFRPKGIRKTAIKFQVRE
jgi:DNA-binding transcriptional ArsR family regulator